LVYRDFLSTFVNKLKFMNNILNIKPDFDPSNAQVGVIMARFQVAELHEGHKQLIDTVLHYHDKVIIFLGVNKKTNDKKNPLDFANRRAMINELYPNVVILPQPDVNDDNIWSKRLDNQISLPFGEVSAVIYGSRDSFIPHYKGKYKVIEVLPKIPANGTALRNAIAKSIIPSVDFRKGIIYHTLNQRPVTFPTVDVCAFNKNGEILMAKKPNEHKWRFVGGFVDANDKSYEDAAKREFREETGGTCSVGDFKYITSQKIDDWRYRDDESGIMTTLFLCEYLHGKAEASDDIAEVKWIPIREFSNYDGVRTNVIYEHRELMQTLVDKVYSEKLIPNIGERKAEVENVTYHGE
jgi:bifunctional NMN adenylyltransferase/nudix hydrolase